MQFTGGPLNVTDRLGNTYVADPGPGPEYSVIPKGWDRQWYVARKILGGYNILTVGVCSLGEVTVGIREYLPG